MFLWDHYETTRTVRSRTAWLATLALSVAELRGVPPRTVHSRYKSKQTEKIDSTSAAATVNGDDAWTRHRQVG